MRRKSSKSAASNISRRLSAFPMFSPAASSNTSTAPQFDSDYYVEHRMGRTRAISLRAWPNSQSCRTPATTAPPSSTGANIASPAATSPPGRKRRPHHGNSQSSRPRGGGLHASARISCALASPSSTATAMIPRTKLPTSSGSASARPGIRKWRSSSIRRKRSRTSSHRPSRPATLPKSNCRSSTSACSKYTILATTLRRPRKKRSASRQRKTTTSKTS